MSEAIKFTARPEVIWHSVGEGKISQGPGIRLPETMEWTTREYAIELTPVEPVYTPPWDDLPDWVQWIAQQEAGCWGLFEQKPVRSVFGWGPKCKGGRWNYSFCGDKNPNWRNTRQQRPEPEPLCPVCGKPTSEHSDGLWCCPYCGGKVGVKHTEGSFGHDRVWVRCFHCPAQTMPLDTEADAVAAWSRRV